jgi:hypothetical protein
VSGRPLRFLGVVLGGWIAVRVAWLWPSAGPLPVIAELVFPEVAAAPRRPAIVIASPIEIAPTFVRPGSPPRPPLRLARHSGAVMQVGTGEVAAVIAAAPLQRSETFQQPNLPPPLPPTPPARGASRLAGSVWLIARPGGSDAAVPGAQLGGSQAGLRLTYALDRGRRLGLSARISTPLEGRGQEAALGVEWRPFAVPVRLIAEQRWSLDGGRGGPTLLATAGMPPTRIGPLEAEAYAQGGAIARERVDGFVDGAARLAVPIVRGPLRLDLGVGAWGGAQPGAARVDVGPSLGVGVPLGSRRVRVGLDWRERIAGTARPGSGPALSIGSDF